MKMKQSESPLFNCRLLTRIACSSIVLLALVHSATAYTLVFRDGHRVEVPTVFSVTTATLTYEAAPGINRTVQLVLLNIAATEQTNHEAPGGFYKHAETGVTSSLPAPSSGRHAQRTLTNLDLETIRQRRIESEQNYERRRIELGLPSIEETRRRQEKEEEATLELARRRAADEANDEAYWRNRAAILRNEIIGVDGEINYVRGRLGPSTPFISQSFLGGGIAFGPAGSMTGTQPGAGRMGTMGASPRRPGNLTNLGGVALPSPRNPDGFRGGRAAFGSGLAVAPYLYSSNVYDLNLRLDDLLQRRAGLDALWRQLEYEARMAKAPQVWLAP
jgi:hypothetical protein